jgi:cbb3-type cytochrome oxidase subunit 1
MLSHRLIYTAVAFFVIGVALGTTMGAMQDFRLIHVHAHVNLLGWVALGLAGLLYAVFPQLARGWLAHSHYWLHTLGLVLFMGAFAWGVLNEQKPVAAVATGASMVSLGVLLFAINVFSRLRRAPAAA